MLYLQTCYYCDTVGEYSLHWSSYYGHICVYFADSTKKVRKPKPWKHPQPITVAQLRQMRDEFWDTAPHYGGRKGTSPLVAFVHLS